MQVKSNHVSRLHWYPDGLVKWLAFYLFLVAMGGGAVKAEERRILVIHSYNQELDWVREVSRGIETVLGSEAHLEFYYLDTKRLSPELFEQAGARALSAYRSLQPDLVILADDNALRLLGETIAVETPVVFCGINGDLRSKYRWVVNHPNITGILERPMIKRTIVESMKALGLEVDRVMVLLGNSPTAEGFFTADLNGQDRINIGRGLQADVYKSGRLSDWKNWLDQSVDLGYRLILAAAFQTVTDNQGRPLGGDKLSRWLSESSPVPIITVHEEFINHKALVGGMVIDGGKMGVDAALMARSILNDGQSPGAIPIEYENRATLIFSSKQLEKWHLGITPRYKAQVKLLY